MNRRELFELADKYRVNGVLDKEKLRQEIIDYLKSDEGQKFIQSTPRITVEASDVFPLHEQSLDRIADLIIQEV